LPDGDRNGYQRDYLINPFRSRCSSGIASGKVTRLAAIARFDHDYGRDAEARIGGAIETIECEVTRHMGPDIDPEVLKLTVEDAMENRRPRW
jgi:hypothetical protein